MVMTFIYFDTKKTKRRFWPYAVLALLFGSFGALVYFILGKEEVFGSWGSPGFLNFRVNPKVSSNRQLRFPEF